MRFMNAIPGPSRLIMSALIVLLILGGTGCKSKKKAMEAAKAEAERARMEQQAALERERAREEEERRKREAEEKARREAEVAAPAQRLESYFNAIANSQDVNGANNNINEALRLFASPDTPVLIVIHESNGQKDYDRPTTIREYLNYLKDQKKNMNRVGDLKTDASGKITELELLKN